MELSDIRNELLALRREIAEMRNDLAGRIASSPQRPRLLRYAEAAALIGHDTAANPAEAFAAWMRRANRKPGLPPVRTVGRRVDADSLEQRLRAEGQRNGRQTAGAAIRQAAFGSR